MKDIYYFLSWQWKRWEIWKKWFVFCFLLIPTGILLPREYSIYPIGLAVTIYAFWLLKWLIWDGVKESYGEYRSEQVGIIKKMKDLDR
jgi:hypothetical protein